MIEDDLFDVLDAVLNPLGSSAEDGEEYRDPALGVLRFYRRSVRLHWLPWIGRAWSVTAVVRQPIDVAARDGYPALLDRVARATHSRFPPGRDGRWGMIGLTMVVLTPEPIGLDDDATLQKATRPWSPNTGRPARPDPAQSRSRGDVDGTDGVARRPLSRTGRPGRRLDDEVPPVR